MGTAVVGASIGSAIDRSTVRDRGGHTGEDRGQGENRTTVEGNMK